MSEITSFFKKYPKKLTRNKRESIFWTSRATAASAVLKLP